MVERLSLLLEFCKRPYGSNMEPRSRRWLHAYYPSRPSRRRFGRVVFKRSGTSKPKCLASLEYILRSSQIYTISQDGTLFRWSYSQRPDANGDVDTGQDDARPLQWRVVQRHYFMQNNAKVRCAAFHAESNLLVAGFSNGLFGLYELPDFNMIHTLRCSSTRLTAYKCKTDDASIVYLKTE